MAHFSVDTHLFRELGELLVGRDSTALVELIKNAYDADATDVVVSGARLDDPSSGVISITDNGNGMTPEEFTRGFLRIASRQKDVGTRRSPHFRRRYTGAKGVGRLAAHKLARVIEVLSISREMDERGRHLGVDARIDWNKVEAKETLEEVVGDEAIRVTPVTAPAGAAPGTTITLRRVRRPWSPEERMRFMEEVRTFEPPPPLVSSSVLPVRPADLLVPDPVVRDEEVIGPWSVTLEGEFEAGDPYWQNLAETAHWIIEIDALTSRERIFYSITPAEQIRSELEHVGLRRYESPHPAPNEGPFFQARILAREGRAWQSMARGVRVFMEGFRVLPYGEPRNDWLGIDADVTARTRTLRLSDELFRGSDPDAGLSMRPNRQYFGGVFLTQANAPSLRMLVNREGFVPEGGYNHLVSLVRTGIDLSVRVRAAARYEERVDRRKARAVRTREYVEPLAPAADQQARAKAESVRVLAAEARHQLAAGNLIAASETVSRVVEESEALVGIQDESISEHSLIRVLASVGMQLASFIHEIQALLGMAQGLENALERLRSSETVGRQVSRRIAEVLTIAGDLRRSLERQASYLLDVVTPDARRRRSRQYFRERFASAVKLVTPLVQQRGLAISDELPADLKSPPMFPAELAMVFTNLLTNAVKAAGEGGRIRASAQKRTDGRTALKVENTGTPVTPDEGERWFSPFESTTSSIDPILGQGMGLGLPITRSILEEYGAEIHFVEPSTGYATAVEILFPR